ncbi:aspartate aminotransferase family protein [Variovorax sp. 2RAF20]|jgi:4-aminobutyrate--pyruvate transaminase|uniref:aspartate aminotransferase family protein n=1 Tax=Variovorax sp. CF313 TaxID=1144315 RepID=UPI000270DBDD|nr:aspartate aminotransferase family protein [Variovorax sp. CF313]EJL79652.1 adenosylmethionine-8-amino-7-oxononanoate aminotransferase [Variovorax sp. CF313]
MNASIPTAALQAAHAERAANDIAAHLHPFTNLAAHPQVDPLVIERGDGIYVEDDQGRRYLEAMSGLWCVSLGFSNARLAKAGSDALHTLPCYHTFNHRSNAAAIALAEKLLSMAPVPMSKVFFANSGSEANDTAVKLVWYYHNAIGKPGKKKIIARRNAYHGVTVAAASLSGLVPNHRDFDLPIDRVLHVDCPHHYRYAEPGETEEAFATRLADALEQRILAEGPDTVGAFIAEPVMGAGGVLVPPATYFEKVQAVLRKYEVLLIADEVICGFCRTGEMFGSTTFGLRPDILTAAKALSSGYVPISAVMVSEQVHAAVAANSGKIGTFGHGFTYSGHPVTAAVALETLRIYEDEQVLAHVQAVAPQFQAGLRRYAGHSHVGEVRGVGLIGALELAADPAKRMPFDAAMKAGARLAELALQEGLIVRAMGDAVAFCPPLIITPAQIDEMFERFDRAMVRFEASLA